MAPPNIHPNARDELMYDRFLPRPRLELTLETIAMVMGAKPEMTAVLINRITSTPEEGSSKANEASVSALAGSIRNNKPFLEKRSPKAPQRRLPTSIPSQLNVERRLMIMG